MAQEVTVEGKSYISSKRAAQESGYAQDYIGQLARKQLIDARRIGGLWYVSLDSLTGYQKKAEEYKPQPPIFRPEGNAAPDTVVSFDGRDYLSASRAAEITGYHQDYIGQLARSGAVLSRQIGNRWYVDREGILAHKTEKDALLGAVQSESVGITRPPVGDDLVRNNPADEGFRYYSEGGDLMPRTQHREDNTASTVGGLAVDRQHLHQDERRESEVSSETSHDLNTAIPTPVPIRKVDLPDPVRPVQSDVSLPPRTARRPANAGIRSLYVGVGAMATIVLVLSVGYTTLRGGSTYALAQRVRETAAAGEAAKSLEGIATLIERFIPPLVYNRK